MKKTKRRFTGRPSRADEVIEAGGGLAGRRDDHLVARLDAVLTTWNKYPIVSLNRHQQHAPRQTELR